MIIRKLLSANDVGMTGSHQAGIAIPKAIAQSFFPSLDAGALNPDVWLTVCDERSTNWSWRFVYYNNRLFGRGTRNEYRLTHTSAYLRSVSAQPGDRLELEHASDDRLMVRYIKNQVTPDADEVILLTLSHGWQSVSYRRRR